MFIGEHSHTIDDKGRINLPAKYRDQLQAGVVITRGLDGCLFAYTIADWQEMAEKLAKLPLTHKKSRAFARLMLAGAWDAQLDSQGRIMVPEYLRTYAHLQKYVTSAGVYNRIELWDEDAWHTYRTATEADSVEIAEGMAELGI